VRVDVRVCVSVCACARVRVRVGVRVCVSVCACALLPASPLQLLCCCATAPPAVSCLPSGHVCPLLHLRMLRANSLFGGMMRAVWVLLVCCAGDDGILLLIIWHVQ